MGLRRKTYGSKTEKLINDFYYKLMPKRMVDRQKSVFEAIGDLPKLFPLDKSLVEMNVTSYIGIPLFDENKDIEINNDNKIALASQKAGWNPTFKIIINRSDNID